MKLVNTETPPPRNGQSSIADHSPQIWIRLPRPGEVCPYSGMKRTALESLTKKYQGKIKVALLREPGTSRGNRLIWWPSLNQFLHDWAERGEP